jgi:pimeloyl-ACP methyl ester carboxylesterase
VPFARCHGSGQTAAGLGDRLHYAERGETRPGHWPVLLIHGAGGSSALWMMVMARLARFTRAVAIDLPGHGPSPASEEHRPATLLDYRDATGALAALTGLGPSVLVGHSMGALVALECALAWPDKVVGLVLCGAAPRLPVDEALMKVLRESYPRFPEWLAARALSPAARPALRRSFVAAGVVAPQEVTIGDFEAVARADLGPRLGAIACPLVWLDGADDQIAQIARDEATRPGPIRRLPDVGHLVPIEAPAEVAEATRQLASRGSAP